MLMPNDKLTIYEDVMSLIAKFEEEIVLLNSAAVEFNNIHEKESVYLEEDKDIVLKRIKNKLYEGSNSDE